MRLVGISFEGLAGPVTQGHVVLGDVTALIGPNDSGKSRLMAQIADVLEGLRRERSVEKLARAALFFEAERPKLLMRPGLGPEIAYQSAPPEFAAAPFDLDDLQRWSSGAPEEARSVTERLDWIAASAPEEHLRTIAKTFGPPYVLAYVPPTGVNHPGVGSVALCVPPETVGVHDVKEALRALGVSDARLHPSAPLPFLVIDEPRLTPLVPRPLRLPTPQRNLEVVAHEALVLQCHVQRYAARRWAGFGWEVDLPGLDRIPELEGLSADDLLEEPPPPSHRSLLESEDDALRIHPAAVLSADEVSAAINANLAPFVGRRYHLTLELGSPASLLEERPCQLRVCDRESGLAFPVDEAASGLRLWLELAISEGASAVAERAYHVLDILRYCQDLEDVIEAEGLVDDLDLRVSEAGLLLHARLGLLSSVADQDKLADAAEGLLRIRWPSRIDDIRPPRSYSHDPNPMYFIDEPEQHLHPKLQREACTWLAELMSGRQSQALVTTHAGAFLDPRLDVAIHETVRERSAAVVQTLGDSVDARTALAAEMGLDRGELLSGVRVFCFVEGVVDRAILTELFGDRLRQAGIELLAINGHRPMSGLPELELLLRYLAQPVAVLLDGITSKRAEELRRDARARKAARRSPREDGTIAKLVEAEIRSGRQVEIIGIGVPDIFDALNEAAVRHHAKDFPGHPQARRAFEREHPRGWKAADRKAFYRERFGVDFGRRWLARVAHTMVAEHLEAPILEDAVDRLEQLSLTATSA